MRIITTALIVMCSVVSGFAQTPSPSPENWRTVAPTVEDFSVEAPVEMTLARQPSKMDLGRTYFNDLNGTYFRIFSEKRSEADSIEKGLEFIRGFEKKGSRIAFGGTKAEKFDFEDNEKFFHRVIYLETASRAYLFHTISENRDDNAPQRFLRSLQIAGRPISGAGTDYDATTPPAQKETAATTTGRTGDGPGSDRGIWPADRERRGSGTQPSTATPAGAAQKETAGATPKETGTGSERGTWPFDREGVAGGAAQNIKVLTKPRAQYTDLARKYYISGKVTIRITFLASGEIGAVTPVRRLPFGMTGQAISAAKAITFEPARMNGVPFTKVMTVEYGFTIY